MKSFLKSLVLVPLIAVVTVFAVMNREMVAVTVDPLDWTGIGTAVTVPMFVLIFAAVAVGVIAGGLSVWITQGRYRRAARQNAREAARQRAEVERLRAGMEGQEPRSLVSTIR